MMDRILLYTYSHCTLSRWAAKLFRRQKTNAQPDGLQYQALFSAGIKKVLQSTLLTFATGAILFLLSGFLAPEEALGEGRFRIGFSKSVLGHVNENDAMAAIRAWSQALAHEQHILATPESGIYHNINEIQSALINNEIESLCLSIQEYAQIQPLTDPKSIIVGVYKGSFKDQFVLIVHRDNPAKNLGELRLESLGLTQTARSLLPRLWLESILAQSYQETVDTFFSTVVSQQTADKVVLPVFFRKLDAALVNKKSLAVLGELNPQIRQQIKILKVTPEFIPMLFCFRKNYPSPLKKNILQDIEHWHMTPVGRQILMMFNTEKLKHYPTSILSDSLNQLRLYEQAAHQPAQTLLDKYTKNINSASLLSTTR